MRNSIDLIPSCQPVVTYITGALLGCNIPLVRISTHESPPTGELEVTPYRGIRGPRWKMTPTRELEAHRGIRVLVYKTLI